MRAFIISLFLGLGACSLGPAPEHVARELSPETRTLLSGRQALALTRPCSRPPPGPVSGQWTPSARDLDAFDMPLTDVLGGQLARANVTAAPRDYDRQYAGLIINGRRVIYVNGVNRDIAERQSDLAHPVDWRNEAIILCDGGSLSFGAEFDAVTHQVTNFAFDGSPSRGPS